VDGLTSGGKQPRVLARPEHHVSRSNISANALKVLYRLHRAGYLAYLVGGSVRDLMIGLEPKDFDVATNARPQEIRRLFRNSRIIGRRFRLVHVLFRGETVEVSTFRASPEPPDDPPDWDDLEDDAREDSLDEEPIVAREEEIAYGTPQEDAHRRDLTVNALFYNVADFSVIDFVGGIDDLEGRTIRTIGPPEQRFQEDPVRMMRALEYSVRLGFRLDPETSGAIEASAPLIAEASSARLTYELVECLRSGHAAGIFRAWNDAGLLAPAFSCLSPVHPRQVEILGALDRLGADSRPAGEASVLGAVFLPGFIDVVSSLCSSGRRFDNERFLAAIGEMIDRAALCLHIGNHTQHLIRHGLFAVTKMRRPPERGRQVIKLVRQDYFAVTWDFLTMLKDVGFIERPTFEAWARAVAQVQRLGAGQGSEALLDGAIRGRRRRRSRRRRKT
jgi:poly(A) polymerase